MKALILDAEAKAAHVRDIPRPCPGPGEVLIRVHAIALNPVDSLYVFNPLGSTGRTVGSDWAGTVVHIEASHLLPPGTRVAGFLQGASSKNDRPGAFAEYIVCPADLLWRVPDSMSLEEASTVSLCALTAAQALFGRLGLPAPFSRTNGREGTRNPAVNHEPWRFLIYGASTSVGLYAAQLLRHAATAAGFSLFLIGTANQSRFPMLQSAPYAYDTLIDYREPDWPGQVREATNGKGVDFVFDCISEGATVRLASRLLAKDGRMGIVRSKEGGAFDTTGVVGNPLYGAVWEAFGVEVEYTGMTIPASTEARAFAVAFYKWLSESVPLKPNTVRLMPGGLEKVVSDGFTLLGGAGMGDRKQGQSISWMKPISAEKLVYRVSRDA